jgi:Domain of unknown function (DUF4397)
VPPALLAYNLSLTKSLDPAMKRIFLLASVLITGMLAACGSTTTPAPKANLRVMHASPDAGLLDILLDDKKILRNFIYKDAIGFNQVEAGARNIKANTIVTTTVTTPTTLLNTTQNLVEGRYYTVITANTAAALEALVVDEDGSVPAAGQSRLRVVHAAPAAPAVDIYVTPGQDIAAVNPAVPNAAFKSISPALDIAAGKYFIRATEPGTKNIVFDSGEVTLGDGVNLTLVAVEQSGAKSPISLVNLSRSFSVPRSEVVDINAQIRVVHASPDAPAVDVLLDDVTGTTGLAYGTASAYAPAKAGPRVMKINNVAGTTPVVSVTNNLALSGSASYSLFLMGPAATAQGVVLQDFLSPPTAGNALVRFVHASTDTASVDIFQDDATAANITGLVYRGGSSYLSVPAGAHNYKVNLTGTTTAALPTQALTLEAGKIYTAVLQGSSVAGAAKPLALNLITDR